MPAVSRRVLACLTVAGTAAGYLGASATGAVAATPATFNHLTSAQVLTALPTTTQLPKGVKLIGKVEVSPAASATPCGTGTPKVSLANATGVAGIYTDGKKASGSPTASVWSISAAVFATTPQATTAAVKLAAAETKCKKSISAEGVSLTRTVGAPDTAEKGLWQGYRAVMHITDVKQQVGVRVWTTWFVRGNVLLEVTEAAPITQGSQGHQDALRKTVTNDTLANLDKAAG